MNKRDRLYWYGMGAMAVGLVCAYIFWVAPIRSRVAEETDSFERQKQLVNTLDMARSIIPSVETIEPTRRYVAWLENELKTNVVGFFAASRETLNAPIVADEGMGVSQSRFKAEYQKRRDEVRARFPRTWPERRLFPDYAWLGEGLPNERDYVRITKDFNIRREMIQALISAGAVNIEKIEVDLDNRRSGDICDYIPVSIIASVPPDRIDRMLGSLMNVSFRDGRQSLCVNVRRIRVERADGDVAAQMAVNVALELDVMDFPADLESRLTL